MANEHMKMLDGALLRFLGYVDEKINLLRSEFFNPFRVFIRGANTTLSFPILILLEFGLISRKVYSALVENKIFKLFVFSVSLIGLISGTITIVLSWEEFKVLVQEFQTSFWGNDR